MKTKEEFEALVSGLTELEMEDLLDCCNHVLYLNKWESLREKIFKDDDLGAMSDLEDEVSELESKNEKLQDKIDVIQNKVSEVISILNDI